MGITDDDRAFAIEMAARIYQHHVATSDGRGADENHIAENIDYEETLRRGLLGECAFAHMFGLQVNTIVYQHGDGGFDFAVPMRVNGTIRQISVDVKTKTVRTSLSGLLASGTHLRVPVRSAIRNTLYVFGVYLEYSDDAEVLRWAWGRDLIEAGEQVTFENGRDTQSHALPYEQCRELSELTAYIVAPHKPVEFWCRVCGCIASFGYGVSLLKGNDGEWFCREHRPR